MPIQTSCQAQLTLLTSEGNGIFAKYSNFFNVFFSASMAELPEYIRINNHLINQLDDKQLLYGPIYSLELVELKTLKTYPKANLASGFIKSFKSRASAPIPFVQKKDSSLHLCVDYRGFNNLTIKDYHSLLLISKLLNCLGCAKCFSQLDLMKAYHQMRI